jgi:hypothetical protein
MIDLREGIDSPTNFKRNTPAFLERLVILGESGPTSSSKVALAQGPAPIILSATYRGRLRWRAR